MSKKFKIENPADFFISMDTTPSEHNENATKETAEQPETKPKKKTQTIKKDLSNDYTCYKLSEVASISRLSPRTIQTYVKEGTLPATMVGNKWLVSKEDLERLLRGELVRKNK